MFLFDVLLFTQLCLHVTADIKPESLGPERLKGSFENVAATACNGFLHDLPYYICIINIVDFEFKKVFEE